MGCGCPDQWHIGRELQNGVLGREVKERRERMEAEKRGIAEGQG